jgi:hypothetical protein
MRRIPRPVLRALEALAQSPINTSALAMAEGQDFAHDTLYRALNQPLASFFELSLELCKAMGGLDRGYLILDDVLIQRYRSGKLGLKKARDTSTGAWVFGLSLVVLAWTDGKRRIPLAFLPYFGEESKLDLALALLEWAKEAGFRPEGVLFDAWYAARQVLEWLHAHGWPFVTRLRSNRVLDGVQLGRHGGPYPRVGAGHHLQLQTQGRSRLLEAPVPPVHEKLPHPWPQGEVHPRQQGPPTPLVIPFYAESLVLGHQWKRVCRLRVSGAFSRTRHRSATTSIISSRS